MGRIGRSALGRVALEVVAWVLVVAGIAMLALPGPGMLTLFAGVLLLSRVYSWAHHLLVPVKRAALVNASDSVQSWWRIALSLAGIACLAAAGVVWGVGPAAPSWWPLREDWWLVGGWGTGAVLIGSAVVALALLVYSYLRFRETPYDPEQDREREAEYDREHGWERRGSSAQSGE